MHKNLTSHRILDNALLGFGIGFVLLFVLSTTTHAATACDLSFGMTTNTAAVQAGGNLTRTITVKNNGAGICRQPSFSLYYAPNETFVSSTPAARASNYYWTLANLGAGKSATVTVTTKHNTSVSGSTIDTEGCATANNGEDACVASSIAVTSITSGSTTPVTPTTPVVVPPVTTPTTTPSTPVVTPTTPSTQSGKELGIWIWDFPKDMLSSDAKLKALQAKGFNTVYITVDDYLDIASMADGSAKTQAINTYFTNLAAFVKKANSYGLRVDAEGGWRDWAKSENRWKGFALIDMVKAYNAAHPEAKLRGFQYDVEPYLLPEYETNKAPVLLDFVTFIDQSVARFGSSDIEFSMSIPHFYDDAQAWTPSFTYNGKNTFTFNHLLNILEKKPGSTILLMSYRNTFDGNNGTRQISEVEVKEASAGFHTKVIVGQETGNVDPAFVTFYGQSKTDVMSAVSTIQKAFARYGQFGGVAVHYLDSFLAMPN